MSFSAKKVISVLVAVLLVFTSTVVFGAQASDIKGHWAASAIEKWTGEGIINGYGDGSFKPDNSISRAEFAAIIARVLQLTEKSSTSFTDVTAGAWYSDTISKAAAAGIITGDGNGTARPNASISRQEAAVILSRAFDLVPGNANAVSSFADAASVAAWSKSAVSAMYEKAYIQGRPGNLFAPQDNITRAEAVKMIGNVVGELCNSLSDTVTTVEKNLVVNTAGVKLSNITIPGDLYITQGVGSGEVTLNGVTVKGRTIVRGGGENSIVIKNSTLTGTLLIIKQDGKVRIVAQGSTEIANVEVKSGAKLQEENVTGKGFENVEVMELNDGDELKLDGDFEDVQVEAAGAKVNVLDGKVGKLEVAEKAAGSEVTITGGIVTEVAVKAITKVDVTGGTVSKVNVASTAADTILKVSGAASVTTLVANTNIVAIGASKIKNAEINVAGVVLDSNPQQVTVKQGVKAPTVDSAAAQTALANAEKKLTQAKEAAKKGTTTPTNNTNTITETAGGGGGGGGGGGDPQTITPTGASVTVDGSQVSGSVSGTAATVNLSDKLDSALVQSASITATPSGCSLYVTTVTSSKLSSVTVNTSISSMSNITVSSLLGVGNSSVTIGSLRAIFGNSVTINGQISATNYTTRTVSLTINLGSGSGSVPNEFVNVSVGNSSTTINATIKTGKGGTTVSSIEITNLITSLFGELPSAVSTDNSTWRTVASQKNDIAAAIASYVGVSWNAMTLSDLSGKTLYFKKSGDTSTVYRLNIN